MDSLDLPQFNINGELLRRVSWLREEHDGPGPAAPPAGSSAAADGPGPAAPPAGPSAAAAAPQPTEPAPPEQPTPPAPEPKQPGSEPTPPAPEPKQPVPEPTPPAPEPKQPVPESKQPTPPVPEPKQPAREPVPEPKPPAPEPAPPEQPTPPVPETKQPVPESVPEPKGFVPEPAPSVPEPVPSVPKPQQPVPAPKVKQSVPKKAAPPPPPVAEAKARAVEARSAGSSAAPPTAGSSAAPPTAGSPAVRAPLREWLSEHVDANVALRFFSFGYNRMDRMTKDFADPNDLVELRRSLMRQDPPTSSFVRQMYVRLHALDAAKEPVLFLDCVRTLRDPAKDSRHLGLHWTVQEGLISNSMGQFKRMAAQIQDSPCVVFAVLPTPHCCLTVSDPTSTSPHRYRTACHCRTATPTHCCLPHRCPPPHCYHTVASPSPPPHHYLPTASPLQPAMHHQCRTAAPP